MERYTSPVPGASAQWVPLPGGGQVEVLTIGDVEYVRGSPPDVVVEFRSGLAPLELKLRSTVARANALCSIHKGYRAIRKPRTNCEQCWEAYERLAKVGC